MTSIPQHPTAAAFGPCQAPRPGALGTCVRFTLEALLLALLAVVLGPRRALVAWHSAAAWDPDSDDLDWDFDDLDLPAHNTHTTIWDGTHLVCEHPILYVIGPGPNRGMRALPRAHTLPHPESARAPPSHGPPTLFPPSPRGREPMPNLLRYHNN